MRTTTTSCAFVSYFFVILSFEEKWKPLSRHCRWFRCFYDFYPFNERGRSPQSKLHCFSCSQREKGNIVWNLKKIQVQSLTTRDCRPGCCVSFCGRKHGKEHFSVTHDLVLLIISTLQVTRLLCRGSFFVTLIVKLPSRGFHPMKQTWSDETEERLIRLISLK